MSDEKVKDLAVRLGKEARQAGYFLNPDAEMVYDLVEGLLINDNRYGYMACPCRDATGLRSDDLDIICPCDYRDEDLDEFGTCYCALYVSEAVAKGEKSAGSIPDRRPPEGRKITDSAFEAGTGPTSFPTPVWRCTVCGYLCAKESPPLKCPVCKADKDRFERFA